MYFSTHLRAVLQALFVTFLWSTSWILIKFALNDIPPLTFAGLRYSLAFLVLLPGAWKHRDAVRRISREEWKQLAALGVIFYALTQGGQFLTLNHLEAITFSLILNFSAVLVALIGILALKENPTRGQWAGITFFLLGVWVYFYPVFVPAGQTLGFTFAAVTVCANAAASVMGRSVNRDQKLSPLVVTTVSMGIGSILLLGSGLTLQGLPPISLMGWIVVVWLAVVNTAVAFTLWNRTLRVLSAVESTVINNTMLIQIAVLAWIFLGERLDVYDVIGLLLVAIGVIIVQITRLDKEAND